ncbi:MAG: class I SAM-dependent methyltransferase [Anaerolineales bacterium]|jgi:2-polyprenyl-3-methyl-5-hydroxy-6-metoxy-1,4-benzoquinol methylase
MSNPKSDKWNEKYRLERDFWMQLEPRQLLTSFIHLVPKKGRALEAACGVGVNAIYLAQHGLRVFGLDISEYALKLAMEKAKNDGCAIELAVVDLSKPWLPAQFFDVITNFHFLERAAIPVFRQALKPGGLILFETFAAASIAQANPSYYLEPGELKLSFQGFEIIHSAEGVVQPGRSHGERRISQLVARKPALS